MPISYTIDVKQNLVIATATRTLLDEDALLFQGRLRQDKDFKPGMRTLADIRNVRAIDCTDSAVEKRLNQDEGAARFGCPKHAIVASSDFAFCSARMYQQLTERINPNVRVFRDMDEARAWLNIEAA